MKMAMTQEPVKIMIEDQKALFSHTQILLLRSQRFNYIEGELAKAKKKLRESEFEYRKAKLQYESAQLHGQHLLESEKEYCDTFFAQARTSNPTIKSLQERYGDGIRFIFDSDDKQVWILGIFASDSPPIIHDEPDFSGESFSDDGGDEDEDEVDED